MKRLLLAPQDGHLAEPSTDLAIPPSAEVWEVGSQDLLLGPTSAQEELSHEADLRLTLGGEVPDLRALRVELPEGTPLGEMDVRYGCIFQPFSLRLSADKARSVASVGARIRALDPSKPIRLLYPIGQLAISAPGLAPHLLPILPSGSTPTGMEDFEETFASLHTLQPFNWIAGCVLDGLRASGHHPVLAAQLDYFFPGGRLRYVGPRGEPRENEIFGIEALLPFAMLPPGHPAIALMRPFVNSKLGADGLLLDRGEDAEGRPRAHTEITIEGCYTLAYPLAIASLRDELPEWRDLAWAQIAARCENLVQGGVVAQRAILGGAAAQADWARAYGWFLLGIARTAEVLGHPPAGIAATFARVANHVLSLQRPDGLWSVYLAEPATGSDTSGSAAIAAGLSLGARLGLLSASPQALSASACAVEAMRAHMAPDGMLGGVAQLNRGGEPLQRDGFRVLAPFAMGLLASARAALADTP